MILKFKLIAAVLFLLPLSLFADETEYVELQSKSTKFHMNFLLNDDFTVKRTAEYEIKALTEKAAQHIKEQKFSHSTSIEKFEVLKAYTLKADGTKVEVPKGNYQVTINKGNDDNGAVFSDRTRVTIVFPDVEINDSVYMMVENIETEPMFPNNFSASQYFWSQRAYDDVKISFDLPKALEFSYQVRKMEENIYSQNGRKIIELAYSNKKPVKIKREDFSVWDESKEAGYALSTFMDYESIAKAYGDRALPKSVPTDRIKKLVKEIIADEENIKQQARLLYEWVATNISYAGNCIGVGAVVPHDTDFILDNRMGDCKDHATLLEAFYRTIGLESTQALINSGTLYALPEIPMVTSVNHVINYIPEWDKFLDSTDPAMPFDSLAYSILDKPVLLVNNFKAGKKTPSTKAGTNTQEVEATMKVLADGSMTGTVSIALKGRTAIEARRSWRHVTEEQEKEWVKQAFSSKNKIGSAILKRDDPKPLTSEFSYSFEFKRPEFILAKGAGGFYIAPPIRSPMSIYDFLSYPKEEIEGYDVSCNSARSIEKLVYEFPENMKILAKPDDFEINENHIYFKANYKLEGNKLQVAREIDDKTPGNVCSADLINQQRKTLMKISDSLKSQVVYQQ